MGQSMFCTSTAFTSSKPHQAVWCECVGHQSQGVHRAVGLETCYIWSALWILCNSCWQRHEGHRMVRFEIKLVGSMWGMNQLPLRRWRMQLIWAKPWPISLEGVWWLLCTLWARMMALNDSKPSVANKMVGPNLRIWSTRCRMMWNFGCLNQQGSIELCSSEMVNSHL